MHEFIRTLYGAVIGISFFNFGVDAISDPFILNVKLGFDFAFFLLTFIIATHDWFIYHRKEVQDSPHFSPYLPQICAVLFIGLMFNSCTLDRIIYWYAFGGLYTICNITSFYKQKENEKERNTNKWIVAYSVHIALCVGFLYWLSFPSLEQMVWDEIPAYKLVMLLVTIAAVVGVWFWRDYKAGEKSTAPA